MRPSIGRNMTRLSFAERLNRLFDTVYPPDRYPYSSAAVVAGVRATGTPMSAPYLSQLRSGNRDNPSAATMAALAKFFGVDPAYFTDDEYADEFDDKLKALSHAREHGVRLPSADRFGEITESHVKYRGVENDSAAAKGTPVTLDMATLANQLNTLFDTTLKPGGIPWSSEEVASTLQEDGFPITASVIARLRSGLGELPGRPTMEGIAYFFNVSPDSFADDSHPPETYHGSVLSEVSSGHGSAGSPTTEPDIASFRVRFDDIGRCVSGLAESSIHCLDAPGPDLDRVRRLMALVSGLGAFVSRSDGKFSDIPASLRVALTETWTSIDAEKILDRAFGTHRSASSLP
jgi:transcriptional regulator with XRE-family HTH domain